MRLSKHICSISAFFLSSLFFSITQAATDSPENASVYIISPANGEALSSPFTVTFGLRGMGVAPAGMDRANTGHHHLLIDGSALPDLSLPLGSNVRHFGGGQTEVELTLEPGKHSLQLILGDKLHVPHHPAVVSNKIEIVVK